MQHMKQIWIYYLALIELENENENEIFIIAHDFDS
jgi:hypothetical protein